MKTINNFSNYGITSCGRVWNYRLKRFLKMSHDKDGYLQVNLRDDDGKQHKFQLHRLVAMAYIPNPDGLPQVSHLDEDLAHNWAFNLEWATAKTNNNMPLHCKRISDVKGMRVLCIETNTIYNSIDFAAGNCGISACSITNCIMGRQKTAGGYHWEVIA